MFRIFRRHLPPVRGLGRHHPVRRVVRGHRVRVALARDGGFFGQRAAGVYDGDQVLPAGDGECGFLGEYGSGAEM